MDERDCSLGPGPDDICWVLNLVYQRDERGLWRGWLEPLPGPLVGANPPRLFESADDDIDKVRADIALEVSTWVAAQDEFTVDEFNRRHARELKRRDLPDAPWPPTGSSYRKLDFVPPES